MSTITLPPDVQLPAGHNVSLSPCAACGIGTFKGNDRRDDYPQVRDSLIKAGLRRREGRGLCSACYMHYRSLDQLDQFPTARSQARGDFDEYAAPCTRCGLLHRNRKPLCADCELVVADLHETEAWT